MPGRVNMLLVSRDTRAAGDPAPALARVATLDDLGLSMRVDADYLAVEGTRFLLKSHVANPCT